MASIQLRQVKKTYGALDVIKGVDLDIKHGEFCVFVGPSGCGKSTLLRMISGLEELSGGDIVIGGDVVNTVPAADRGLAMVFQSYALYPHMTVFENIAFPLRVEKMPEDKLKEKVEGVAKILKLDQRLEQRPGMLSGGQRQRVAIARALATEPRLLLLDEPTSMLDVSLRLGVLNLLRSLQQTRGMTMLIITHDLVSARYIADRVAVLSTGRIVEEGQTTAVLTNPQHPYTRALMAAATAPFAKEDIHEPANV